VPADAGQYENAGKPGSGVGRILDPRDLSESERRRRGSSLQRRADIQLGSRASCDKTGCGDSTGQLNPCARVEGERADDAAARILGAIAAAQNRFTYRGG